MTVPPPPASPLLTQGGAHLLLKRMLDVTIAVLLLVVLAPLFVATAVAILVDTGPPVLYRGTRIGQNQRPFTVLKFRSMVSDADDHLHSKLVEQLLRDPASGAADDGMYKLKDDPRVTRVGRVIRRTSLDELPQLINVLRGEMSLVGPRPEVPYALEHYERWQMARFGVLPGLTGLWQVSGRAELAPAEMLRLDVEYARNWSLALDVWLLLRTVPVVLRRVGCR